ncbi:uncharacterized protein [Elaeis guineensis]|uniref:Uncharacterized protein LOC105049225 n=1 Tax=Elaeis guineensis var. tenera TaxID=51953 RepID=A0A8N4F2B0_ELAGV|nr:uncharacterized protein LOC105049225 [Elaeis guineensis]
MDVQSISSLPYGFEMESSRSPARKARGMEGETGTRATTTEDFYLPLADALKMINVKVNLFASVSEIRAPKRSRGTDTDFRHAAFATLMDSLTYPEVTHRCKCIV